MARKGLGRGLGALMTPTQSLDEQGNPSKSGVETMPDGSYFLEIPVDQITPNPKQPRQVFDEDELAELAASIDEVGLLQPITVRKQGEDQYELIMGERRWRAHQLAKKKTVPAIVRVTDDEVMLRDALIENLHRVQLNALEEAAAYEQLMTEFNCTQEELSLRIKKSRPHISNTIRLLRLPASVQRKVAAGVISAGHARAILTIDDPAAQERMAERIIAEGLSVRSVEELVSLGELGREPSKRIKRTREIPERATEVAEDLTDHLDTRVKVTMNAKGRGKIQIDFGSEEDLDRILQIVLPS